MRRWCNGVFPGLCGIGICLTLPTPPAFGSSSVILTWDSSASTNVVGYKVYYGLASGVYDMAIPADGATTTNAMVTGLTAGTSYFFAITAVDALGDESQFSNEAVYSTPKDSPTSDNPAPMLTVQPGQYVFAYYATNTMPGPHHGQVRAVSNLVSVLLRWPSSYTGFGVQQNDDLANVGGWSDYPAAVNDDGTTKNVLVTPQNGDLYLTGNRFFRLSRTERLWINMGDTQNW